MTTRRRPASKRQDLLNERRFEMAKTAVTGLTDHIEAIRREAYDEGYAAAMRAVAEFSGSGTAKSNTNTAKATTATVTSRKPSTAKAATAKAAIAKAATASQAAPRQQRRAQAKPTSRQTRRGDNAQHIAEAMMTLPDRTS